MFRVEIDFPNGITYFERENRSGPDELNSVGIVFQVLDDVSYQITGIARKADKPAHESVQIGDKLLGVDRLIVTGANRAVVIRSLSGRPGVKHRLRLLRNGRELIVEAMVQRLL